MNPGVDYSDFIEFVDRIPKISEIRDNCKEDKVTVVVLGPEVSVRRVVGFTRRVPNHLRSWVCVHAPVYDSMEVFKRRYLEHLRSVYPQLSFEVKHRRRKR